MKIKNLKSKIIIILALLIIGGLLLLKFWPKDSNKTAQVNSVISQKLGETKTLEPAENNFNLSYPKDMKVIESELEGVEGGRRILVESGEAKKGFEIIVLPFDEEGSLTKERILADVPDMEMNNVKNISVGNNISALSFESTDENLGKTFEIWFVSNGRLYEARTYIEYGGEMEEILKTWKIKL
jgi:hypothetical protein